MSMVKINYQNVNRKFPVMRAGFTKDCVLNKELKE
jgi:hypothetical protein